MPQNKTLVATCIAIITIALIILEIYVDIHTGVENATTTYQKNVMAWMGGLLGSFSALSVLASGALKRTGKKNAYHALLCLSTLLVIYSLLIWISFFATMWFDFSNDHVTKSVEHQAKTAVLESLQNEKSPIDSIQLSSEHVIELNNSLTNEELAVKKCSKLKSWKNIRDCKNNHGAAFEKINLELAEIEKARSLNSDRLKTLSAISSGNKGNSLKDFVMMPLAAIMTNDQNDGRNFMLCVAVLITVIISFITNAGLYFVGELIIDEIENGNLNFMHSPAPLPNVDKNNDFVNAKKEIPLRNFNENLNAGLFDNAVFKSQKNLSDIFKTSPAYNISTQVQGQGQQEEPVFERGFAQGLKSESNKKDDYVSLEKQQNSKGIGFLADIGTKDKDAVCTSLGTDVCTQTRTEDSKDKGHNKIGTGTGTGKSEGSNIDYAVLRAAVIDNGEYWNHFDSLSVRNLVDFSKIISPNGKGIGKDKASVYLKDIKNEQNINEKGEVI